MERPLSPCWRLISPSPSHILTLLIAMSLLVASCGTEEIEQSAQTDQSQSTQKQALEPPTPLASTLVVTTLNDPPGDVPGTLRHALMNVPRGGKVVFDDGLEGTITLRGEALTVRSNLTNPQNPYTFHLEGPGADKITIDANHQSRILSFNTSSSTYSDFTVSGLRFIRGAVDAPSRGGAIDTSGGLTIYDCVFEQNTAPSGGAISTATKNVSIRSSTFFNNSAHNGGAIHISATPLTEIENSTFYQNSAADRGGAIFTDSSVDSVRLQFNHVTFADNSADLSGAVITAQGQVLILNSLIANNTASSSSAANIDVAGPFSLQYSLVTNSGPTATLPSNPGTIFDVDPHLGSFGDHGGTTPTLSLLGCSPAIDAADPATSLATDQRGSPRHFNGRADMGAFERQQPRSPCNTSPPSITGDPEIGEYLSADPGSWASPFAPTFAFQWERCDDQGQNCAEIAGATDDEYRVTEDDATYTLRVVVTASIPDGSTSHPSDATDPVSPIPPSSGLLPSIEGTVEIGETLTINHGTWRGAPAPTFTYQWGHCGFPDTFEPIAGATDDSYEVLYEDAGLRLCVEITGTNIAGSDTAQAGPTAQVPGDLPQNTALPAIIGTVEIGETVTADPGQWTANPDPHFDLEWHRCNDQGESCAFIQGAAGSTFTITPDLVNSTLRLKVYATNTEGSVQAISEPTTVIPGIPPTNTTPPSISDEPKAGSILSLDPGQWDGVPEPYFTYQWYFCDDPDNPELIPDEDWAMYIPSADDVGRMLCATVTAHNNTTDVSASTNIVGPVRGTPPRNNWPPTIDGTPEVGNTLTADPGGWIGTPDPTFTYQWQRCDAQGQNCAEIAGATDPTYTIQDDDADHRFRVAVTGSNYDGHETATSDPTPIVPASAPQNTAPPTISGTPEVDNTLTADPGQWSGIPTPQLSIQWERCDEQGQNCIEIPGATAPDYTLFDDDAGHTIRVTVTASNSKGDASVTSPHTTAVPKSPSPIDGQNPQLAGPFEACGELFVELGQWSAVPAPTFEYQWFRCDADADGDDCADLDEQTDQTYLVQADDMDQSIGVVITASNSTGSSEITLGPELIKAPPRSECVITELQDLGDDLFEVQGSASRAGACQLSAVELWVDQILIAQTTPDEDGDWSAEISLNELGEVFIACQAIDSVEQEGPEYEVSAIIDTCWHVGLCDPDTR